MTTPPPTTTTPTLAQIRDAIERPDLFHMGLARALLLAHESALRREAVLREALRDARMRFANLADALYHNRTLPKALDQPRKEAEAGRDACAAALADSGSGG